MELPQGTPILIKLRTRMKQQGGARDFHFDLRGQMVTIGSTLYIWYEEMQEETDDEIPVTIKLVPGGHVQLTRAGEMQMRLKFSYKEWLEVTYRTPYGVTQIATFTRELHVSLKDRPTAEKARIDYDLFMGLEEVGKYYLTLDFTA